MKIDQQPSYNVRPAQFSKCEGAEEAEKPFEFVYQDLKRLRKIQKRFSFTLDESSDATVPVFVRIKPLASQASCDFLSYDAQSGTITVKKKSVEKSYKFTHILKPETTQEKIFENIARPYLRAFLEGTRSNIFMFTYGASSSGKTYTIQGEKEAPGILPRLIATLFKSLDGRLESDIAAFLEQGAPSSRAQELELEKSVILKLSQALMAMNVNKNHLISLSELEGLTAEAERLKAEDRTHGVWFSYYEIYNEQVYDLLDEPGEGRPRLRILNDRNTTHVEGLKWILVSSLEEAYLVYSYGRYNLTVSSTAVNSRSSRSHSVFSIRVASQTLNSSFSVCDLAGTERAERTKSVGLRLREAQRINTSFLTLNRCLRTIRENQTSGQKRQIPYRESKLTKVLGPAMTVPGTCLVMLVTVSQDEALAEETESSLSASSVAASIRAAPAVRPQPPARRPFADLINSQPVNWNEVAKKTVTKSSQRKLNNVTYVKNDTTLISPINAEQSLAYVYKELHEERIKRKLAEEKLVEMDRVYKEKIEILESECTSNLADKTISHLQKELEEQVEDSMASRAEILRLMKTVRIMKEERASLEDKIKNLESINKGLNKMLDDAKDEIETLQNEARELDKVLQEKEQIILLKDDKLHSREVEIFELEQNLEKNASEIEAYDKQLAAMEEELKKKKKEIKDIHEQMEKSSGKIVTNKLEYDKKENSRTEKSPLKKQSKPKKTDQNKVSTSFRVQTELEDDSNTEDSLYTPRSSKQSTTKKQRSKSMVRRKNLYLMNELGLKSMEDNKPSASRVKAKQLFLEKSATELSPLAEILKEDDETEASPRSIFKILRTGKKY